MISDVPNRIADSLTPNRSHRTRRLFPLTSVLVLLGLCYSGLAAGAATSSGGQESARLEYTAHSGTWMSVDVHPSGEWMVFDLLGHLYEMSVTGGGATRLTSGRSWNTYPRYSPDGKRIAFTSDRGGREAIWVLNRSSGEASRFPHGPDPTFRPSWTQDGRAIVASTIDREGNQSVVLLSRWMAPRTLHDAGFLTNAAGIAHDPYRGRLYVAAHEGDVFSSGSVILSIDRRTGNSSSLIRRPGGAASPAISPDGSLLAYVHRRGLETELRLRDLTSGRDRALATDLSRDRQEYPVFMHGAYPNIAWTPDGGRVLYWSRGGLRAASVDDGSVVDVPFRAPVEREARLARRHPLPVPSGPVRSSLARWPTSTDAGLVFEALGDLWIHDGHGSRRLTTTPEHELSPLVDEQGGRIFFATWSDREGGAVRVARFPEMTDLRELTTVSAPHGALALSPDGETLVAVRADPVTERGVKLESQSDFEIVHIPLDGTGETVLASVSWRGGGPEGPSVTFSPDGHELYFTFIDEGTLTLGRTNVTASGEVEPVYRFPDAMYATVSPDLHWIAFNEYRRTYVTPFLPDAPPTTVRVERGGAPVARIGAGREGLFVRWSADGESLGWVRGTTAYRLEMNDVEAGRTEPEPVADLELEIDPLDGGKTIAYRNARILTMNGKGQFIEDGTILVRDDRIVAVGRNVSTPPGTEVRDLSGRTVIPGLIDVHAHYRHHINPLQVIEQRSWSLSAYLAYGVTTIYEVFGGPEKGPWLRDALRAGQVDGPRLFTVGPAAFGFYGFAPKRFRPLRSLEDARELVAFNRAFGATALKDYLNLVREERQYLYAAAAEAEMNVVAEPGGQAHDNWARVVDGVQGLAHSQGLSGIHEDIVRLLATTGVGVTPTLGVKLEGPAGQLLFQASERLWEDPKLLRFETREALEAAYRRPTLVREDDLFADRVATTMKRLLDAGVPVQVGGHGARPGLDVHWEMELLVRGGFSPMEALEAATIAGARHHGLADDLGSIAPGKKADFVILRANPLEDIRNARAIDTVVKNGVLYSGEDGSRITPRGRSETILYFRDGAWSR